LERTLRIEPHNSRALRGVEWLDSRQKEIDEARAAAERVKPYWQTSKPKPLLNLIKGQAGGNSVGTAMPLPRSGEQSQQPASWTSVAANIPNTRVARANMPTAPVSGETLDRLQRNPQAAPVNDRQYREEVLETDDELAPRFVTNIALHNLMKAVDKVTGASGLAAMLRTAGLEELEGLDLEPDETPAINYTRFSAFSEAMEDFYTHAVDSMEYKVGREMFRQELAMKGKMVAMKGITFKLMSPDKKLRTILMELADAHARMGMEAYFEEREGGYLFGIETCPYCYGRLTNAHCNVTTGFLAAGIEWATGRALEIQEVSCRGIDEEFCGYWIPV
jgi:predicted hydrocarbon binding protein